MYLKYENVKKKKFFSNVINENKLDPPKREQGNIDILKKCDCTNDTLLR